MFWKKKKKPENSNEEESFQTRVEQFWEWWIAKEQRLFETIEAGKCGDLQPEISEQTNRLSKDFAWVFGPPAEGKSGHSFTLSGEGILHHQFLADYWLSRAPELANWTFYASRQPGSVDPAVTIEVAGQKFDFGALWVTPTVNEEKETVDIIAWHPAFEKVDEKTRGFVLFLMLDEVLGEFGTDSWLGSIEQGDTALAGAIPVTELREFLHEMEMERGWKKLPPTECYSSYQLPQPDDRFLRSDTVAGTTANMKLIQDYLRAEGQMEDPITGTGADFVFVAMDRTVLPQGKEVEFRSEIEDAIAAQFETSKSGRTLGGAIGNRHAYLDFLIYDQDRSLEQIKTALVDHGLPSGTGIHFFAKGKEGRRIFI